jgi:hypothetical protein
MPAPGDQTQLGYRHLPCESQSKHAVRWRFETMSRRLLGIVINAGTDPKSPTTVVMRCSSTVARYSSAAVYAISGVGAMMA